MKTLLLSTAALLIPLAAISAADAPPLKEGLWSIHTQTINNPGNKKDEGERSICRNHAYDDRVRAEAKKVNCKTISESSSGGKITTESECKAGDTVIRTKATVTMAGDSSAHSETRSTFTPPMYGMSETMMIMEQKFVGACPAGMAPGDMMNADGKIVHRRQ